MGFALRFNHKQLAATKHPDRNLQFRIIELLQAVFLSIGRFRNAETSWRKTPCLINDYDFRSLTDGIAIPFGIYNFQANIGSFYVGCSYDTLEFAVVCTVV